MAYIIYPFLIILDLFAFPILLIRAAIFNPDIIYSNTSIENLGILLARILRKKHITHVREFGDLDFDFKFVLGDKRKREYLNLSTGILFNSTVVQNTVLPKELQKTKIRTVYNGVPIKSNKRLHLHLPEKSNSIVFGLVGYLHSNKNQLQAIEYLKEIIISNENIKVEIYGDGDKSYVKSITDFIVSNKLIDKISFKGFEKDINKIFDSISILLVFAQNEAFGRVTIEAMERGIPVIAYRGGGTLELIEDKFDGLLFENKGEFIRCVESLLNSKEYYSQISINSINSVREKFSEDTYCNNVEDFICECMVSK